MAGQRGQALLEFALAAPLVLIFLLAIVDFGIAIDRRVVLQHAVREGARYAAVGGDALNTGTPATKGEIQEHTAEQSQGIADAGGVPGGDNYIEVCYEDSNGSGSGNPGDNVRVRAHYVHNFVTGFTSWIDSSLGSITMEPEANVRLEQPLDASVGACG